MKRRNLLAKEYHQVTYRVQMNGVDLKRGTIVNSGMASWNIGFGQQYLNLL